MADGNLPDIETLRKLLAYDPETGALTWRYRESGPKEWNTRFAMKPAGSLHSKGYVMIRLRGGRIYAHRAAWALANENWPKGEIDHINGDPSDNRISNLRDVSPGENRRNQKRPVHNTTGAVGVYREHGGIGWKVAIGFGGENIHIGHFSDFDAAVAARKAAEAKYGFHPGHGRG